MVYALYTISYSYNKANWREENVGKKVRKSKHMYVIRLYLLKKQVYKWPLTFQTHVVQATSYQFANSSLVGDSGGGLTFFY